ncbi:MAG: hypothetical protein ACRDZM_16085 [Acidimicrobiia bacterium]
MHAFSGAILGPGHDAALPTVAQIDGESLILSSSDGPVGKWPFDRVQIIEVGNGHFEVVDEDRRLSLLVDQPKAFEEALEAERARRALLVGVGLDTPEMDSAGRPNRPRQRPPATRRLGGLGSLSRRPRHGRASVRTLPFVLAVAAVISLGYLAGSFMGDLLNGATTREPEVAHTPSAEVMLRTFQGSADEVTSPFMVQAPWKIRWSLEALEDARLEVIVLTDDDGDTVAVQAGPGSGAVPLTESGVYRLEIKGPSGGEWTVSVVQVANADSG